MSFIYTPLGAAGEVTGSSHLLEHRHFKILLDCGMFQGGGDAHRDNRKLLCGDPHDLDAVVLSHAHADHCGRLPMLVKHGFSGEIYCTPATARIAAIMLKDSAYIQGEDAAWCRKKFGPDHPGAEPLYELEDVDRAVKLFTPIAYGEATRLSPYLKLTFREAGHILGSAITQLEIGKGASSTRLVFTGDLGRRGMPLLRDPVTLPGCDVLISECTYGDKVHSPPGDLAGELLSVLTRAVNNGGRVVIPAFSLGRTQQVVYYLNELSEAGVLPQMPYYVDSPLATRLTAIYRDRQDLMDDEAQAVLTMDDDLFDFDELLYTPKRPDSIAINEVGPPFCVISASGMCEAGRVVHHLARSAEPARLRRVDRLPRPRHDRPGDRGEAGVLRDPRPPGPDPLPRRAVRRPLRPRRRRRPQMVVRGDGRRGRCRQMLPRPRRTGRGGELRRSHQR